MNVAVAPPAYIAYMRSELIAFEKFLKFVKKNVNLLLDFLPGQPDQQEILRSFPKNPTIQALRRMGEADISRWYRQYEPMIVYFRSFLKKLLHHPNNLPLWLRQWCEVEPPHNFEFANDYVSVEDMRAKLIEYNTSMAFLQSIMPDYPSVEQLMQANPDEVRKYYDIFKVIIDQVAAEDV